MKMISITRVLMVCALGFSASSFASGLSEYSESKLAEVEDSGGAAVLAFHAVSCGTCKKQKPILDSLLNEAELSTLTGLRVAFEDSADLKKKYRVSSPSTIIVVRNGGEIARSTGVTDKDDLRTMLLKGVEK